MLGLAALMMWSGGPVTTSWPLWRTYAWAPFFVPLVYLVATAAYPQPVSRFLKVSLLHTFIIFEVRDRGDGEGCTLFWRVSECKDRQ